MDSKGNKCTKRDARKLAITDVLDGWGMEPVLTLGLLGHVFKMHWKGGAVGAWLFLVHTQN